MPEPSPLFWDHLAGRIRQAIPDEPPSRLPWLIWSRGRLALAGAAAAVLLIGFALGTFGGRTEDGGTTRVRVEPPRAPVAEPAVANPSGSEAAEWSLVVAMTSEISLEDASAAGWPVGPLETWEGLEQLRFLENGVPVHCVEVAAEGRAFWELNNPTDIPRIETILRQLGLP